MKLPMKMIIATAIAGAGTLMTAQAAEKGYCWGVTAKGDGGCGGKAPAGVSGSFDKKWPCAGNAGRAEWGWKKDLTPPQCEAMKIHPESKASFEAAKQEKPIWTKSSKENPLYEKPGYLEFLKSNVKS